MIVYTSAVNMKPRKDILCFTDPLYFSAARRASRIYKILSHHYVKEDSIYIDSNVYLKKPPEAYLKMLGRDPVGVFPHWHRDCLYQEGEACKEAGLDDPAVIDSQLARYEAESFPEHAGLGMCFLIVRRAVPLTQHLNTIWWEQYCTGSVRDQISFPYAYWSHIKFFPPVEGNDNEWFERRV
jgi:hypothetical protein